MARDYAKLIGDLLRNANDESLPDEARQQYRDKAEVWMKAYQIEEEEAIAEDPTSALPITKTILIRAADGAVSHITNHAEMIFKHIADHCGVRYLIQRTADWAVEGTVVGYAGDVRYFEFLWTAAYLMFATRIDPVWQADRSEAENIFFLRQAGIERRHIADMAWGNGNEASARSKVQRIYIRECARRGETPLATGLGFTASSYRQAYSDAFISTLRRRLRLARDAANSVQGGVVLHGRSDRVDEAFYERFPNLRPSNLPVVSEPWVDPTTTCPKCAKAKTTCRGHSYMRPTKWTQADERREQTRRYGASARAGRGAGEMAAEGVNLARGAGTQANRLDRANGALEG
jgi:hypothetical protein